MTRSAAYAPHLGAALAAGLLVLTGTAFQAGKAGIQLDFGEASAVAMEPEARPPRLEPAARAPEPGSGPQAQAAASARPRLAVIIDDVGMDKAAARRLMAFDIPLTLSILPYAEAAPDLARTARAQGHEVFLHLPMEPVGLDDPGPLALARHLPPDELALRARWALSRVPGARGFNNHMGSRLTADAAAMDALFEPLAGRELVFVDSLTSAESVAGARARAAGLTALRRDVFLDHDRSPEAVSAAIETALATALDNGQAIAIGHPHAATLDALEDLSARAAAAGVDLVTVSTLGRVPAPARS